MEAKERHQLTRAARAAATPSAAACVAGRALLLFTLLGLWYAVTWVALPDLRSPSPLVTAGLRDSLPELLRGLVLLPDPGARLSRRGGGEGSSENA
jgi:hypothetical protein